MAKVIRTEVKSDRVAQCVKYDNGERALFVCWGHDGAIFIAETGFAPLPFGNFAAACLAAERELGVKGNDPKTAGNPITVERGRIARRGK